VAAIRRLKSARSSSDAWNLNGRIDVSPLGCAVAAAPITEVSATAALPIALGADAGEGASAPPGTDRAVSAWVAVAGRNMPIAPTSVDDEKRRLPINGCSPGMIILLVRTGTFQMSGQPAPLFATESRNSRALRKSAGRLRCPNRLIGGSEAQFAAISGHSATR
jgi:hypothetical protein